MRKTLVRHGGDFPAEQVRLEVAAGVGVGGLGELLRRALGNYTAAGVPCAWAQVDDPVSVLDQVHVVLDKHYRIPGVHEPVQHPEQVGAVLE